MKDQLHAITPTGAFKAWASVMLSLVGVAVALVLTIGYVKKVDQDAKERTQREAQAAEERNVKRQREICGIIRLIDDRNQTMPPAADPATAEFRREVHAYRTSLGC